MRVKQEISLRRGVGEAGGRRTRWYFDGRVLEAVLEDSRPSKSQAIYEVHVADLVIDEETGEILEIHILPDKHDAPQLIKDLRQKKLLNT